MSEALHVYRSLLRAVDRCITSVTGNRQWREYVASEFRKNSNDSNPARVQHRLQAAQDYAFLITSVRDHKALLLSYNIGIHVDTREKDMNKRAAELVGLQMPPKTAHTPT